MDRDSLACANDKRIWHISEVPSAQNKCVYGEKFCPALAAVGRRTRILFPALAALAFMLPTAAAFAQNRPTLEMQTTNGGPAGTGPTTASQVVTFRRNNDNPGGNTFVAQAPLPAVTVTYSLSNQQYTLNTTTESAAGAAVAFGSNLNNAGTLAGPLNLYMNMNTIGAPANGSFTSTGTSTAGTGIEIAQNGAIEMFISTRGLFNAGAPTNASYRMADLTLTFSRPVNNPVLHFAGTGGMFGTMGIAPTFDLLTPGLSLTRLSGNAAFATGINPATGLPSVRNAAVTPAAACNVADEAACGSVRVVGNNLSSISFRIYLRGDGLETVWATPAQHPGDGFTVGVSLDVPPRIRLQKALGAGGRAAAADQFALSIAGPVGGTATTVTTNTTGTGTTATGTADFAQADVGATYTLSEAMAAGSATPLTGYTSSIACVNATANSTTVLPSGAGTSFTLTTTAADDITCTLTNTRKAVQFRLAKVWGANSIAGNVASIAATTGLTTNTAAFTSTAPTNTNGAIVTALVGEVATLPAETFSSGSLANYTTALTCDNGVAPSGSNGQVSNTVTIPNNLPASTLVTCSYTNTRRQANLSITKTNTPGTNGEVDQGADTVMTGNSTVYTVIATNAGPDAAHGAIVRDQPVGGLSGCVVSGCTQNGGAACPATPNDILNAGGATLPVFPANASVHFVVACTVN